MIVSRRRLLGTLVVTTGLLTACASPGSVAGKPSPPGADRAVSPRVAALAFHRDWTSQPSAGTRVVMRYDCMPPGDYGMYSSGLEQRPFVSSVSHRGTAWVVSISDRLDRAGPESRYRVRFDHGGYCVDKIY